MQPHAVRVPREQVRAQQTPQQLGVPFCTDPDAPRQTRNRFPDLAMKRCLRKTHRVRRAQEQHPDWRVVTETA